MKTLLALFLLSAAVVVAQSDLAPAFPGIKTVMSPEDFARAGLSGLTADQLGLIDAAIIRHYTRTVTTAANQQAAQIVQQTVAVEHKKSFLDHFGLPDLGLNGDWRNVAPLKAKCTGWSGGNSFKLDNGQEWEGVENIPVEVAGRDIEIQARPGGQFCLFVAGENTTIRVHRIK
jgi:hypothetical protein